MTSPPDATTPPFDEALVRDAMHHGVLTCPPGTPVRTVARMMASYRVHAIVVTNMDEEGESDERAWGVLSDIDLARAAAEGTEDATAGGVARTEAVTIGPTEPLKRAAELMSERGVSHLLVAEAGERAVGIVSTYDIARALVAR